MNVINHDKPIPKSLKFTFRKREILSDKKKGISSAASSASLEPQTKGRSSEHQELLLSILAVEQMNGR